MPLHGFASSRPQPSTRSQALPRLSQHAVEPSKKMAPGSPNPLPAQRERRLPALAFRQSTFANPSSPSETLPSVPYAPVFRFVPDARGPFSGIKNPFVRPR